MSFDLTGKKALVTGASRGIGRGIAVAYAAAGADVALLARNTDLLAEVAGEVEALGRRAVIVTTDVMDADATRAATTEAIAALGGLDVLVNNAGGNSFSIPVAQMRMSGWEKTMRLNLDSIVHITQESLPALGDGGGSIRIPAACCGLVGMKPTRDRNPNGGEDSDRAIGLAVDHVVSRSVRDSAAMLDATGYPEPASPYAYPKKERPYLEEVSRSPGRLKIFWSAQTPSGRPVATEMTAAIERTAECLAKLGHEVREHTITLDWRTFYRAQAVVSGSNFAAGMARMVEAIGREPGSDIGPLARRGYDRGREITGQQAMWGWQQLRLMSRMILSVFEECDVYLSPVLGTEPPKVDWLDPLSLDIKEYDKRSAATFPFTPAFNITGQPSLSLPLWQSGNNLPLAMMFTGRYGDEGTLYRLAGQLEKEIPWKDRRPPIWN